MSANIHTHKHLYIFSPQVDPKPFYIRKKKKKKLQNYRTSFILIVLFMGIKALEFLNELHNNNSKG